MAQQKIIVKEVSEGFYSDTKSKVEVRELCNSGSFSEALLLRSNRSGKEWVIPWNKELQCYKTIDAELTFIIEPIVPACGFGEFDKYRVYVIKD